MRGIFSQIGNLFLIRDIFSMRGYIFNKGIVPMRGYILRRDILSEGGRGHFRNEGCILSTGLHLESCLGVGEQWRNRDSKGAWWLKM